MKLSCEYIYVNKYGRLVVRDHLVNSSVAFKLCVSIGCEFHELCSKTWDEWARFEICSFWRSDYI